VVRFAPLRYCYLRRTVFLLQAILYLILLLQKPTDISKRRYIRTPVQSALRYNLTLLNSESISLLQLYSNRHYLHNNLAPKTDILENFALAY
jgi:hypothetical protein